MGFTALDTTTDTTPILDDFIAQGGTHISRYIASGGAYKLLHKPEAMNILAKKLGLLLNFEGRGNDINAFSAAMGTNDATLSLNNARDVLGAPQGTAIYFSCEPENLNNLVSDYNGRILPYYRAAKAVLGTQYRIGAYTFGTWLDWLFRDHAIDFAWLPGASGWAGYQAFLASNRWAFRQIPGQLEKNFHGVQVDWDEVNPTMTDVGAWGPSGAVPQPNPQPRPVMPPTIRRGSTGDAVMKLQTILHLTVDGRFGPLTESAVKTFQTAHGLVPDAVVGPLTWAKLTAP